jgi:hypothetical protein
MKPTLLTLCFALLSAGLFAQSVVPNSKVLAAFTSVEISAMTPEQLADMNVTAERLCWFEAAKGQNQSEVYPLTDKNGNVVTLTPQQILDFNPLLYTLPQDQVSCKNLTIVDSEGNSHLLIVRSHNMMNNEIQRSKIKNSKGAKK